MELKIYLDLSIQHHPLYNYFKNIRYDNIELIYKIKSDQYTYATTTPGTIKYNNINVSLLKMLKLSIKNTFAIPTIKTQPIVEKISAIQGTNSFMYLSKVPWFTDTDCATSFFRHSDRELLLDYTKKIVAKLLKSKKCKGVIALSESAVESIKSMFNNDTELLKKCKAVYPGAIPQEVYPKKSSDKFKFLFVGRGFYEKGGREVIEAFSIVTKKIDGELHMVTRVPEVLRKKFSIYSNIYLYNYPLENHQLNKLYHKCHCLLLPSFFDTYGYVIMEAKSYGVPTICTDTFALSEIVENMKSGIVLKSPISYYNEKKLPDRSKFSGFDDFVEKVINLNTSTFIKQLSDSMIQLAEGTVDWKYLSRNCYDELKNGKFSVNEFKKRMLEHYNNLLN